MRGEGIGTFLCLRKATFLDTLSSTLPRSCRSQTVDSPRQGLGAAPSDAAFVGDSPFDVEAGKAAGVFTVAVAWGNIHPVEALAGADALVESPEQLLDVL